VRGTFIPVFFVTTGLQFDVNAPFASVSMPVITAEDRELCQPCGSATRPPA
jgi:hypothetical protein